MSCPRGVFSTFPLFHSKKGGIDLNPRPQTPKPKLQTPTASKTRWNNLKGFKDFYLKATASLGVGVLDMMCDGQARRWTTATRRTLRSIPSPKFQPQFPDPNSRLESKTQHPNSKHRTPNPKPQARHPKLSTLHLKPETPIP